MMHLKNIKAGNAKTLEQYELTKKHGVIWLYSEDGKNWYEEVKNFQPDTIKIVYDENNIIVATLDVTKEGKMSGNITHSGGNFTSNGITVHTHKHGGVKGGSDSTGGPQ